MFLAMANNPSPVPGCPERNGRDDTSLFDAEYAGIIDQPRHVSDHVSRYAGSETGSGDTVTVDPRAANRVRLRTVVRRRGLAIPLVPASLRLCDCSQRGRSFVTARRRISGKSDLELRLGGRLVRIVE